MSESKLPTLDSIGNKQYTMARDSAPLYRIITHMLQSGFHSWGFVIYRCTYSDQKAWEQFVARIKQVIRSELQKKGRLDRLWQYHELAIIEDPELDGALPHVVRQRFKNWVEEQNNPPADDERARDLPRFNY